MNSQRIAVLMMYALWLPGLSALWPVGSQAADARKISYSRFLDQLQEGQVAGVVLTSKVGVIPAEVRLKNGVVERTVLPGDYRELLSVMREKLVDVEIRDSSWNPMFTAIPFLVLAGVWVALLVVRRGGNIWPIH